MYLTSSTGGESEQKTTFVLNNYNFISSVGSKGGKGADHFSVQDTNREEWAFDIKNNICLSSGCMVLVRCSICLSENIRLETIDVRRHDTCWCNYFSGVPCTILLSN